MKTTKEKIYLAEFKQFSKKGYQATSYNGIDSFECFYQMVIQVRKLLSLQQDTRVFKSRG